MKDLTEGFLVNKIPDFEGWDKESFQPVIFLIKLSYLF